MMMHYKDLFVFLFVNTFVVFAKKCNSTNLEIQQCAQYETCVEKTEHCECLPNFTRNNGICENITKEHSSTDSTNPLILDNNGSHIVAGVMIPLFLILVVICGIYIFKRYELMVWFRSKLNKRSTNYDEVMIGQDDDDDLPLQD